MSDQKRKPVTIDHTESVHQTSQTKRKSNSIKDSASKVTSIAEIYGLDALIAKETPEKSLLERAISRQKRCQEQRQKNLEQIMKLALTCCKDETAGEPDQDWLYRFLDMAQDIHNASMQRLWAQVLKLEITNPGSTSMKALKILKDMTPREAQNLQRAASLACSFGTEQSKKLLLGFRTPSGIFSLSRRDKTNTVNLGNYQLPYSSLLLLIELGLILGSELESGEIDFDPALPLNYQGKMLTLQPMNKGTRLIYYRFSPTGNELCKLLGNKPNMQYYDQLVALLSQKFTLHTEINHSVDHVV